MTMTASAVWTAEDDASFAWMTSWPTAPELDWDDPNPTAEDIERINAWHRAMDLHESIEPKSKRALIEQFKAADLLPIVGIDELRSRPAPKWLVEDLLQEGTVAVLAGEPGLGKSFLSLDIAACLATGTPFHGQAVTQASTMYVVGEGLGGLVVRMDAWERAHNVIPGDRLMFVEEGVSLSDPSSIERTARTMKSLGFQLVILDTLSQLSDLEDENAASQISKVLKQAALLSKQGLTVLIVHHTNKSEKGKVRGSSAIRGNVDTVIVARGSSDGFRLSTERTDDGKQRNGQPIKWDGFTLRQSGPSAVVHREVTRDPFMAAMTDVLSDGEWHALSDFQDAVGDDGAAASKRMRRYLERPEFESEGNTSAKRWRDPSIKPF